MNFSSIDPRIKPCLVDFLKTKVKYAKQFGWKFDCETSSSSRGTQSCWSWRTSSFWRLLTSSVSCRRTAWTTVLEWRKKIC